MVYQSNSGASNQKQPKLTTAIKTMPRWKWRLLGVALVIGLIGVVGQGAMMLKGKAAPTEPVQVTVTKTTVVSTAAPPAGSSGFVSGSPAAPAPDTSVTTTTTTQPPPATFLQSMTPFMTHIGFSLFVGLIVGLIFRTFLRWALMLTALIVAGAMALSYFHIMNLDLTMVKNETSQATNWLTDQGYRLKDMLFSALPSSTGAAVGFIFGFKKR